MDSANLPVSLSMKLDLKNTEQRNDEQQDNQNETHDRDHGPEIELASTELLRNAAHALFPESGSKHIAAATGSFTVTCVPTGIIAPRSGLCRSTVRVRSVPQATVYRT